MPRKQNPTGCNHQRYSDGSDDWSGEKPVNQAKNIFSILLIILCFSSTFGHVLFKIHLRTAVYLLKPCI